MTESVLIGSLRRSGGTLLARLFDGHPECSVLPFEAWHLRRKACFRAFESQLFPHLGPNLKLRVCGLHGKYDRKLKRAHPEADLSQYRAKLRTLAAAAPCPSALYLPCHALYFEHFGPTSLRPVLVNHCAQLCLLSPAELGRVFGDFRMLLSVRDPRALYCSLVHHRPERYSQRSIPALCRAWQRSVERYHLGDPGVISFRFEDLVDYPEKVMRFVCDGLGIDFDAALLTPTCFGRPVAANSSFRRSDAIDCSAIDGWKSVLDAAPRQKIEARLGPLMRRLGYV